MLRAHLAVGLCAAASVAAGLIVLRDGEAPRAAAANSCSDLSEQSFTTGTLHDLRSFADAMVIVRGVRQAIPPAPDGPEGWAGLIGRTVTARIERVLWRRPNAPEPPRRFRFSDWGWSGDLENKRPLRICGVTRMEVGRRYLAPIARSHGEWFPFPETRLRLRGNLVVGGVDGGEPENSHQALAGRNVAGAVRLVAQTMPYRAAVLRPGDSPAHRWQAVYRDHYRIWRGKPGMAVIVRSGVTARSRWQLYIRLPARGGMCIGMSVRPLWRGRPAPSGEGCGARRLAPRSMRLGLFMAAGRGLFAYGHVGAAVLGVRVRFEGEEWQEVQTLPTPIPPGGRDRLWVAPAAGDCEAFTVQALDRNGDVVDEQRAEATPPPPAGSPDPYAACRSG